MKVTPLAIPDVFLIEPRELGWKPAETFEIDIRKTVEWCLDNEDWLVNVQSGAYREWIEKNYEERIG